MHSVSFNGLLAICVAIDLGSLQGPSDDSTGEEQTAAIASRTEEDPFQLYFFARRCASSWRQAIAELDEKEQQVLSLLLS